MQEIYCVTAIWLNIDNILFLFHLLTTFLAFNTWLRHKTTIQVQGGEKAGNFSKYICKIKELTTAGVERQPD